MKINLDNLLISGAGGMLGSYFTKGLRLPREEFDITNVPQVEEVVRRERPEAILHLAAATDMKRCEEEKEFAYEVNAVGTYHLALIAREVGAKLIYVSTNAVFGGGKEEGYLPYDLPRPVNLYGHSKYLGELAVLGMQSKNLIVRSSWIFGGGPEKDKKFVGKIFSKLQRSDSFSAVDDVHGTPTYAKDLAFALEQVILNDISGIIHCTNSGSASRYDMTLAMKEVLGSKSEISGAPLASFGNTGNTLQNEILNSGEYALRPWQEALKEYLETEWKTIIKE